MESSTAEFLIAVNAFARTPTLRKDAHCFAAAEVVESMQEVIWKGRSFTIIWEKVSPLFNWKRNVVFGKYS